MKQIKWQNDAGETVACIEKVKVMEQNLNEISSLVQDTLDDGVLMNISEDQIKQVILQLINSINSTYKED